MSQARTAHGVVLNHAKKREEYQEGHPGSTDGAGRRISRDSKTQCSAEPGQKNEHVGKQPADTRGHVGPKILVVCGQAVEREIILVVLEATSNGVRPSLLCVVTQRRAANRK
jgi:hypothetical protein